MAAQKQYIANNPVRKNYPDYPHVHTRYVDRIGATRNGKISAFAGRTSLDMPPLSGQAQHP